MDSRSDATELLNAKLLNAINDRKTDDIKKLIADGADLAAEYQSMTPIQYAASKKLWQCVRVIAESKNTDANDSYGYASVLTAAADHALEDTVHVLIKSGAPLNTKLQGNFYNDGSILHWAVRRKHKGLIQTLIALGADLSLKDSKGNTPISIARSKNDWVTVEQIAKEKHTDETDSYDYRISLIMAVVQNREAVAKCLLEAGAKTDYGYTAALSSPLHVAVSTTSHAMISLLLDYHADLSAVNNAGKTPIEMAVDAEQWDIVELIAKHARTDAVDAFHYNAALLAAEKAGRKETVNILLAAGTPATGKVDGDTLLHRALSRNDLDLIPKLIKNGVDLSAVDKSNRTAMDYAVTCRQWEAVALIARSKTNDEKDTYHYGNALVAAVHANQKSVVYALLHANALNNSKNNAATRRILHDAIYYSTADVVKQLVIHNANLAALDSDNHTSIQHAALNGYWHIVEAITKTQKANASDTYRYGSALETAVYCEKYEAAKCLLEANAPLSWKSDSNGVLHRAVINHDVKMLELLLKHGADLSAVNSDGKTAMQLAVESKDSKCAGVMIQHKTDTNDSYHYGASLLYAMQQGCHRTDVKAFIAAGACNSKISAARLFVHAVEAKELDNAIDISTAAPHVVHVKKNSNTMLHIAVKNNDLAMLRLLLEKGVRQTSNNLNNKTPIELAAELGNWQCVQLLLEFDHQNGNDKQLLNDLHFEQALLIAIQKSHYAVAKLLLEHHAPCNQWTVELGNIALYWAVKNNERNPEMVTLLLEHGADASLRNKDGKTLAEVAKDMRHYECASRLNAYPSMVKPGKTAEQYRRDANELYQRLSENATRPEEVPDVIRNLHACYRALLQCDLAILQERRETLKKKDPSEKTNPSVLSLLDFLPHDTELDDIKNLITVINTILNYPDKLPSPRLLRKGSSIESNDVTEYIVRKSHTEEYLRRVRSYLLTLSNEISRPEWKVRTFLGTWVNGLPSHIKAIRKELDKLPLANKPEEIYSIYSAIVKVLYSIDSLEKRHERTSDFYVQQKRALSTMSFVPLPNAPIHDAQVSADRGKLAPSAAIISTKSQSTYSGIYPKLDGEQVAVGSYVPQANQAPVMTPQPLYYSVATTPPAQSAQHPVPSAPDPEPSDVVFPSVPTKPIRQASDSSLYQRRSKGTESDNAAEKKKSGGRVALLG